MKNRYVKGIAITFLALLAIVLGFVLFKYGINHKTIFTNIDEFKEVILSYGSFSFLVFLFIQILQIVLFFIPGEAVQVAGGYIFGPYISFLLCISGAVIGSAITFLVTRKFGKPFLQKICGKDNLWLVKKLDSSKSGEKKHKSHRKLIFALYLIPGVPKDLLGYICGVADISLKDFLILSTVGRAPALFFSCVFGNRISDKNWTEIIILTVVFLAIFGSIFLITRRQLQKIKQDVEN